MKENILSMLLTAAIMLTAFSARSVFAQDGKAVEGTWRLDGQTAKTGGSNPVSWFIEWTFDGGAFTENGYPPFSQKGKYRITKTENNKLTVELYDQSGDFGTKNKQIEITIDTEKDQLKIDGKEGFKRIEKKKTSTD